MLRSSLRRVFPRYIVAACQYSQLYLRNPFLGLRAMAELETGTSPNIGQTRSLPESQSSHVHKKPRLDPGGKGKKESKRMKKSKSRNQLPELCSPEDVLRRDIIALLGQDIVDHAFADGSDMDSPFAFHEEVELDVKAVSSTGNGLAIASESEGRRPWTVVVPFCLPGEKVRARIYRNSRLHSFADLVEVVIANDDLRDPSRVQCKYFGVCAGCQYQMLSYETQLDLKRDVVAKAYKNFSDLPESSLPPIQSTMESPLQFNYRTKITPHFEAPSKSQRLQPVGEGENPSWLKIGFNRMGTQHVLDIEECPIATPIINETLTPMRANIAKNILTYKKGVSLVLRDSVAVPDTSDPDSLSSAVEKHVCVTDHRATVRENVGDWIFEYTGGSFFQNNNSVLMPLTTYVSDSIFRQPGSGTTKPTHLVDAYCGAGLFAITLSPHFSTVAGIELSSESIKCATRNAELNHIPSSKIRFLAGDAANIFATVTDFPPNETVLVIDPPRKGCDENFIKQLLKFRCRTVVYVSCNVHTQARDVGMILRGSEEGKRYVLESLRGFDLFPQTAHVESVAVLRLVDDASIPA